jgi:hypothetical protein
MQTEETGVEVSAQHKKKTTKSQKRTVVKGPYVARIARFVLDSFCLMIITIAPTTRHCIGD